MKPEVMNKIQGLYQMSNTKLCKGKKVKTGPYWMGWFMEDGKQKQFYVGKELPKELQYLLDERVKLPGRKNWDWPAHKTATKADTETHTP